jgi:hypothetical protein
MVPITQVLAGGGLQPLQRVLDLGLEALGKLMALQIVEADVAGDGEAGRDGNSDGGHLGEPGTLAAEHVLHGGGSVSPPLAERIDQRLGVRAAHTRVAISGDACRSRTGSSGVGVGYLPEKQAWQKPVSLPAACSIPFSDKYPSVSTPRNSLISSME